MKSGAGRLDSLRVDALSPAFVLPPRAQGSLRKSGVLSALSVLCGESNSRAKALITKARRFLPMKRHWIVYALVTAIGIAVMANLGQAGLGFERLVDASNAFLANLYFFAFLGVLLFGMAFIILWKSRRA